MAEQKYRVIRHIATGGMAEVFLGESNSVQGFVKKVAIKRVLPHLAQNEKFIQMFLDEARLSARLNHANIVSVFDIGATNNTYFLVMEFVDGVNLKEIAENARRRGAAFEPKQACFVGIEVCRGLSYAHELADEQGVPLGIVHRDISPPNIMITKRGEIKVADFGLAKAGIQVEKTEPGVVKGKFSYLAPEVANGEMADARSDIFSLGVVLWEMLAGRRLFLGETDYKTVKLVQRANIPRLSPLNQFIDESIEEILFKALAKDPNHRYQSAREFGDSMAGYLFNKGLKFTAFDMAKFITDLTSPQTKWPSQEDSFFDRLIQPDPAAAAARFTTDDQVEGSAKGEPSPPRHTGAIQVDGTNLENPADWFTRDSEFPRNPSDGPRRNTADSKPPVSSVPPAAAAPGENSRHPPRLVPPPPPPSTRIASDANAASVQAAASVQDTQPSSASPSKERSAQADTKRKIPPWIWLIVAMGAAGAAVLFGYLIPH
jgi:serine/threonine protein kinase